MIQATVQADTTYYTATARGVEYCAHRNVAGWFVSSRRLSLGRFNTGGGKYYGSLQDLAEGCKAFAGLDVLVAA